MQSQNVQSLYDSVFRKSGDVLNNPGYAQSGLQREFNIQSSSLLNSMLRGGMDNSWQNQRDYNVLNNLNIPSQLTNSFGVERANSSGGLFSGIRNNISNFKADHPVLYNTLKYGGIAALTAVSGGLGGIVGAGALAKDVYDKVKGENQKAEDTVQEQPTAKTNQPQVTNTGQVTNNIQSLVNQAGRAADASRIMSGGSSVININPGTSFANLVNVAGLGRF